ncbi:MULTISPECIES: RES family NAD+ phosphorylase [Clostridium]|uniref:RES family NAD+ phosphorylase n=1 Tax=Clostridium TaxID=1485 RepID=UPI001EF22C9A|nr:MULTISPECIES: RES family NAD+ phosphorylase [Clostridium]
MDKVPEEYIKEARELWKEFSHNIKYVNRYFIQKNILDRIDGIIKNSVSEPLSGYEVYRARIGEFTKEEDLKSPPVGKASNGRGNPRGISYFYTSYDEETAIGEVRPFKGSKVTVAKFETNQKLKVIDFDINTINEIVGKTQLNFEERAFLKILLENLSKPILPESDLEYIPLQYIIEYIKLKGFGGIRYESVVSSSHKRNFLFFDDRTFKLKDIKIYEINKVEYHFKEIIK